MQRVQSIADDTIRNREQLKSVSKKCLCCDKIFKRLSSLKKHMEAAHGYMFPKEDWAKHLAQKVESGEKLSEWQNSPRSGISNVLNQENADSEDNYISSNNNNRKSSYEDQNGDEGNGTTSDEGSSSDHVLEVYEDDDDDSHKIQTSKMFS